MRVFVTGATRLIGARSIFDNHFGAKQFIPLERKQIFPFFSRAENIEVLTPPWLNFHISKKSTTAIEQRSLIEYKLKIHGIPVRWKTLIGQWTPDTSFVDKQLRGPYKNWHPVHTFESVAGGTFISDDVTFRAPRSIFGKILLLPFIRKNVNKIFQYRRNKIRELCYRGAIR